MLSSLVLYGSDDWCKLILSATLTWAKLFYFLFTKTQLIAVIWVTITLYAPTQYVLCECKIADTNQNHKSGEDVVQSFRQSFTIKIISAFVSRIS